MNTSQTIERTTLTQLVHNEQYARKVLPFMKGEYFSDRTERTVFEEIAKFVDKYNTIPTPRGGISGSQLRVLNLAAIERLSKLSFDSLIAGGGIYSAEDVDRYRNMGATDFSISTVYISRPWNIPFIYRSCHE